MKTLEFILSSVFTPVCCVVTRSAKRSVLAPLNRNKRFGMVYKMANKNDLWFKK